MKKRLLLLTSLFALSAVTLTGCGKITIQVGDGSAESFVIDYNTDETEEEDEEFDDNTDNEEEEETTESIVIDETIADEETEDSNESLPNEEEEEVFEDTDFDTDFYEDTEIPEESGEAIEYKGGEEEDLSQYIGMTVDEFVVDEREHSGYDYNMDTYEFEVVNAEDKIIYTLILSDDATEIMENKDFFDDYEDLIGECTIVDISARYVNDEDLQKYVGKTIADVTADGIQYRGYMSFMGQFILLGDDDGVQVQITFNDEDNAIYETLDDPTTDEVYEAFINCPIETITYDVY